MYDYKSEILRLLPITTMLQHFGLEPHHGFICCPFHQDDTASCRIYQRTNTFYCFGCGTGGNVITFAMRWYGLGFWETLSKLNSEFCLGVIPDDRKPTLRERFKAEEQLRAARRQKQDQESERTRIYIAYWNALDLWLALEKCKRIYAPKKQSDPLHPMFLHALLHLASAEDAFAFAESEVIAFESG